MLIYISYNDQIINLLELEVYVLLLNIYISYNDQIINFYFLEYRQEFFQFTFHIMIRL